MGNDDNISTYITTNCKMSFYNSSKSWWIDPTLIPPPPESICGSIESLDTRDCDNEMEPKKQMQKQIEKGFKIQNLTFLQAWSVCS